MMFPRTLKHLLPRCILALLTLVFVLQSPMRAESAPVYYRVRSGDTLSHIAVRYKTTVSRIKRWNRLSGDTVRVGQRLKVGYRTVRSASGKSSGKQNMGQRASATTGAAMSASTRLQAKRRYYTVRRGDTLGHIARRHGLSLSSLRRMNNLKRGQTLLTGKRLVVGVQREGFAWKNLTPHTRVQIPYGFAVARPATRALHGQGFQIKLYARRFAQGHAVYAEFVPAAKAEEQFPTNFTLRFADQSVPLAKTSFGYSALLALGPLMKTGRHPLVVTAAGVDGQVRSYNYNLHVADTAYKSHTRRVYLGDYDRARPEVDPEVARKRAERAEQIRRLIMESTAKKQKVFAMRSANQLGSSLAHPRSLHKITSPFYTKRTTIRYYKKNGKRHYKAPKSVYHHGLDLRGRRGDPIYAMADGIVACARLMHYEGNFTMIDHGQGVFTGYMHQSKFHVREGERVRAGQLIGASGATGAARGAHLHLNLWIRGTPVEPLSLLSLPIRE